MAQLTHEQYDALERAVVKGTRLAIYRSGRREVIVVPLEVGARDGREFIQTRNPTTGHDMTIFIDEVERLEVIK
ncbi:MAG TPA: hypothetical protein VK636_03935 [Gemmatimonadaceae bacterium]|nr:hypothetical protein [Gemmatimonadaceae bacterium]